MSKIDFGHFFSTLPDDRWVHIQDIFDKLQLDIRSGIYNQISTIYGATDYLSYVSAAQAFYENLPELQLTYPELFI